MMNSNTEEKIKAANTLEDYLNILQSNFKTKECKPGRLAKSTVIYTLVSKLNGTSVLITEAMRNKALESNNIFEFITIIKNNFNCKALFSEKAKQNLISDTNKLLLLTGLKEN